MRLCRDYRVSAIVLTFLASCPTAGNCGETLLEPGSRPGAAVGFYEVTAFQPEEGWRLSGEGNLGESRLEGNRLVLDFSKGAAKIFLENSISLPGRPQTLRWSIRGAGVPIRLFLRRGSADWVWEVPSSKREDRRIVAPIGDLKGWQWVGNAQPVLQPDALQLYRIEFLPPAGTSSVNLELGPLVVETEYDRSRPLLLSAQGIFPGSGKVRFSLTARNLEKESRTVPVSFSVVDFSGSTIDSGTGVLTLSSRGAPSRFTVDSSVGKEPFAEVTFRLELSKDSVEETHAVAWERPTGVDQDFRNWVSGAKWPRLPECAGVREEVSLIASAYLYACAEGYEQIPWDECREKGIIPRAVSLDFSGEPLDIKDHPAFRSLAMIHSMLLEAATPAKVLNRMSVQEIRFPAGKGGITAVWANSGTPALLIQGVSTEVELIDLMGCKREFCFAMGESIVPLRERSPMLLVSKREGFVSFDVIASIPDRDEVKAGESVSVACSVPVEAMNLKLLSEPVLPAGWIVVSRSGESERGSLKRSVGVLTPPTAEAGVYYAGFALKLGDQPIQVLARIAVVK